MEKKSPFGNLVKGEKTYIASKAESIYKNTVLHPSPSVNFAVGGHGFVFGRVSVFVGPEGGSKSLNAMMLIAQMQKVNPKALAIYISSEYDAPKEKMKSVGVDVDRVLIKETNIPSEIFDWIEKDVAETIRQGAEIGIIVIDTVKAIRGPKEMNMTNSEDHVIGDLSQYLQKAFRLILDTIRTYKVHLILIQQVTEEMDQTKQKQGIKWHIPNGMALKHVADYILLFEAISRKDSKIFDNNIKMINDKELQVGHRVRVKVWKNRTAATVGREAEFDLMYNKGVVNQHLEVAEMAHRLGIVSRPNNRTYIYRDITWTSKENYLTAIEKDRDLFCKIYQEVLTYANISTSSDDLGFTSNEFESGNREENTREISTTV